MMKIPPRYPPPQRSSVDPPEILVFGSSPSDPYRSSSRSSSYSSICTPTSSATPMTIPHSIDTPPPPPLPPPRLIHLENGGEADPGWQWGNARQENSWQRPSASVRPGSSLYGSFTNTGNSSVTEYRPDLSRRTNSASTTTSISRVDARRDAFPKFDEGYASASATSTGSSLLV
jgi:hypothetical protein